MLYTDALTPEAARARQCQVLDPGSDRRSRCSAGRRRAGCGTPGARSPFAAEDLLEAGIGIYLRGLGLLPQDH